VIVEIISKRGRLCEFRRRRGENQGRISTAAMSLEFVRGADSRTDDEKQRALNVRACDSRTRFNPRLNHAARNLAARAMTLDSFPTRRNIFLEYIPPDMAGGRQGIHRGLVAGVGGYGEGPASLFAFCLPAEHRGVQRTRGYDRRLIAGEPPPPPRTTIVFPVRVFASRSRSPASLGETIRKGVNRNGIIYVRAHGSDTRAV